MADTKTVALRPSETIEGGKELQRVNMSARQLNKVHRMLAEAPTASFVGYIDGLQIEIKTAAPAAVAPKKRGRKPAAKTAAK